MGNERVLEALSRLEGMYVSLEEAIDNPDLAEAKKLLGEINKVHKKVMIENDLENIERAIAKDELKSRVIIDYTMDEFEGVIFIGRKDVPVGPRKNDDDSACWFFRGFCTYEEFEGEFIKAYQSFVEKYQELNFWGAEEYDLYLEVTGGLIGDKLLIDYPAKKYWDQRGVLVSSFGLDTAGNIISGSKIRRNNYQKFKRDIEEIKEQGGPTTWEEAKKLKIEQDFNSIWLGEFNQFYQE
ncbi:hypothetical protein MWH28_10995 [Natroniella sulfidigena]|uniref:hypothetical protein n=1 Tax=Natroniella sulfidigena TaxID=723921 RepID=UPI00200B5AF2|nr:hypothetical protein [Natroniella sulfidigena]MCK8817890.1 hypothetical protein [Natroniella sulfidigena]